MFECVVCGTACLALRMQNGGGMVRRGVVDVCKEMTKKSNEDIKGEPDALGNRLSGLETTATTIAFGNLDD